MNREMYAVIFFGAALILMGVLGLLGIGPVVKKYKGHWWTDEQTQHCG